MQIHSNSRWLSLGLVLCVCGLVNGCVKAKPPWEKVYPAIGVAQLDGQPLGGATLTLIPEDRSVPDTVRPTATTNWDGTFELGTYATGDGAPAGKYKVIVVRFPVIGTPQNPAPGPNDLPSKYALPATTDLTVQINEAETELPPLKLKT